MRIALTGANSSVGTALLTRVASCAEIEVRAGVRTELAAAALPGGPRIVPCVIRYGDPARLAALLDGVACLVHLAGILIESARTDYQTANVDATRAVVEACRTAGVGHIVLVSALGADPDSPNAYYRSKGRAERLVAESGCSAAIIRTPILLGAGTAGGRSLVGMASRRAVRVLGGGRHTLRPLDVDDLCEAILNGCRGTGNDVAIHELVGPEPITQRELIEMMARLMGHDATVASLPIWVAKLGAALIGMVRRGGMTPAVIDVITSTETVGANADAALGVTLTPLSVTLEKLLPGAT